MDVLDRLLSGLRGVCAGFTDKRRGKRLTYSMGDIGMSAFSLFFAQSESFLSHQRQLAERQGSSNCRTLFGMVNIPTDAHIRVMLDAVRPEELQPAFDQMLAMLVDRGGLKAFERLGGRTLIALDGTEYFTSCKLGCARCQTRKRAKGKIECYHSMLAATIVAPGHDMAVPLMPEFISPRDGAAKQDCENVAAKRWLASHGQRVAGLRPVYLGDALFACQPLAMAVLDTGADFLFVTKPGTNKALWSFVEGATPEELVETRKNPAGKRQTCRYSWIERIPLREGKGALAVTWIAVAIAGARGKASYTGSFVTSLPVDADNVAEIVACARARWKIENESFNVLKNNGYHLEHNYGHGKNNLAMVFATMNMLAFAIHVVADCLDDLWKAARRAKGSRKRFFEHIRTLCAYLVFPTWGAVMRTLIEGKPPPDVEKAFAA